MLLNLVKIDKKTLKFTRIIYFFVILGTTTSCWHIEHFCIDIWSWFRHSPARKEDFAKVADELNDTIEKNILYFVCTRWVLLGKVIDRILGN